MDTNIGVNHEKHERQERTQNHEWTRMATNIEVNHEMHEKTEIRVFLNHEWTRMDTNIEVNHENYEIHEKDSEPRMDTNSSSSGFF